MNKAEDLATGKFEYIKIMPGSLKNNDLLGLRISKVIKSEYDFNNDGVAEEYEYNDVVYKFQLNGSKYLHTFMQGEGYEIPVSDLRLTFNNDETYLFELVNDVDGNVIITPDTYKLYDSVRFTVGGLTVEDEEANRHKDLVNSNKEQTDAIKDQTEAIKENNKTNKNIFEKIGELLSYINPLSENFFVYKLIELLINALRGLFVPSEDFFTNWLEDLNTYFGEAFGILYYPFEMLIDFLNRISTIGETSTAIISVPSFVLSFMGNSVTIFNNMSFDLNSILTNDTFKTMHDIYLIFTDIILWLGVVFLAGKCIRSVIGGMGDEVQSRVDEAQAPEKSYQKYVQSQENKKRYNREHGGRL